MGGDRTFTDKESQRLALMNRVTEGALALRTAAERLGISYRQARRLKKAVTERGSAGVRHGNKGRKSARALDASTRCRIIELARTLYRDLNITHLAELLWEEHQIAVSRETVRKVLLDANLKKDNTLRRTRRVKPFILACREGKMVLWGGLTGNWFPPPHPECCFMAALDAATLKCLAARFFTAETAEGYLWLLKKIVSAHGIPDALCRQTRKSVQKQGRRWTLHEQLRGARDPSHPERAMAFLGITQCQVKKRHAWNAIRNLQLLLQDEVPAACLTCMPEGNVFLEHQFIYDYNRRFAFSDQGLKKVWRAIPAGMSLDRICSFCYDAAVDARNRVRVQDVEIKIPAGPDRISYAMAHVEVRRFLNGTWHVYFNDREIAAHAPSYRDIVHELVNQHWRFKMDPQKMYWLQKMYANLGNLDEHHRT